MNCLKVIIILWTCNIAFDTSVTADMQSDINVFELKRKYCGKLLETTIELFCVDTPKMLLESQNKQRNQRETAGRSKIKRVKHKFLKNNCCVKKCNINFIKSNCPGTRKRPNENNETTTTTTTTRRPTTTTTTMHPTTTTLELYDLITILIPGVG